MTELTHNKLQSTHPEALLDCITDPLELLPAYDSSVSFTDLKSNYIDTFPCYKTGKYRRKSKYNTICCIPAKHMGAVINKNKLTIQLLFGHCHP